MNSPAAAKFVRVCAALAGLALSGLALAQPAPEQGDAGKPKVHRPNAERARGEGLKPDPEAAKQRLRRMIEQNKQRGERLEQALRDVESGKDPLEILRDMAERGVERARGGPAEGGPDGAMPPPPDAPGRERGAGEHRPGERALGEGGVERELGGLGNVLDMAGPSRPLTDDERTMVKDVLRAKLPRVAERLEQITAQDPKMAQMLMDRVGARVLRAESSRDENPEVADLRLREIEIGSDAITSVREWRKAKRSNDAAGGEKAGAELRAAISSLFDVRVKLREAELQQVTQKLEMMRNDLNRLHSERDRVVERTFKQMTERGPGQPGGPGGQGRRGQRGEGKPGDGKAGENRPPRPENDDGPPPPRD